MRRWSAAIPVPLLETNLHVSNVSVCHTGDKAKNIFSKVPDSQFLSAGCEKIFNKIARFTVFHRPCISLNAL